MGSDITPGYVWCADCNGLGFYEDSDDDMPGEDVECPRCLGSGEHPDDDDFSNDGLDCSEGMG